MKEVQARLDAAGADFTRIPHLPQRSTIYASDGKTVLAHIYLDNREIVPLRRISPNMIKAVLAIEDDSFYEHGAINLIATFRALIENIRAGKVTQGGSTITQQLVKNTLGSKDVSLARKFQELALAQRVEQHYSKDKILELYLNQVFLGNNVYGVGTAARFYFHEPASQLSLAEAALLAGLNKGPSEYDPIAHPHAAWLRRNDVLNRMIALGPANGGVSVAKGERAKNTDIVLASNIGSTGLPTPPFLVDYVKQQILDDPNGWYSVLGSTPEERERALSEGGLDIVTTLDPDWQKAAQKAANAPWASTPQNPGYNPEPDVAIVSLGTHTGAIRTMLSGRDYQKDQINTVTTQHPPGSSFKPYVLAAAFEEGIPPTATYSGVQGAIPECPNGDGTVWNVQNAEGTSLGSLNLYDATADSVNAVFARLIVDVGPANVVDMAHRAGITTPLPAYCSLATGSVGITPLDQASGYQTFANSGIHCKPYAVTSISRGHHLLYQQVPDCERVVSADVANLVTELLKGPVTYGTAASVFSSGWGDWPLRGKTGTSDLNKELWFAGYTRQVTTAVWVGSPADAVRDALLLGLLGLRRLGRRPDLQGLHAPGHGRVPAPRVPHREAGQGSPGDRHDRAGGDPDAEGRRLEGRHHGDRFLSAQGHGRRAGSAGRSTDRRRCDRASRHQQRRRPARHPAVGEGAEPGVRAGSPRRHQRVRHRRVQGHERSEARRCRLRDEPRRRHVGAGGFERHAARLGGTARAEPIAVAGQRQRQRQQRERERQRRQRNGNGNG